MGITTIFIFVDCDNFVLFIIVLKTIKYSKLFVVFKLHHIHTFFKIINHMQIFLYLTRPNRYDKNINKYNYILIE